MLSFEDEGGQRGNEGGVEAGGVGRVAGGVVGHDEAEVAYGGAAAGLAAEVAPCVKMKGEDDN